LSSLYENEFQQRHIRVYYIIYNVPQYQISEDFSGASRRFSFDFGKTNKAVTVGGERKRSNLIYIYKYKETLWTDAKEKWRRWPRQYNSVWMAMRGSGELYYIVWWKINLLLFKRVHIIIILFEWFLDRIYFFVYSIGKFTLFLIT